MSRCRFSTIWSAARGRIRTATISPRPPPFTAGQLLPHALPGTDIPARASSSPFVLTLVFWLLMTRSVYGFSVRTVGAAPSAARYGGFDASRTVWSTLHDQRRHGGPCRHSRGVEPARARSISASPPATASPRSSSRSLAASIRSASFSPADPRRHLCRRPGGADGGACAERDRRHLPGDDAVLHSRQRHSGAIPRADPLATRRAPRPRRRAHDSSVSSSTPSSPSSA